MKIGTTVTSAPHPFLLAIDSEDSGAQTADRYDWQSSMAAIDAIAAITNAWQDNALAVDISVICEVLEDYIVCIDDSRELVSVKHREQALGGWSLSQLVDIGGLAHLFTRWRSVGSNCHVRLVSNQSPASGDAADLVRLCERLRDAPCGPLRQTDQVLFDLFCHRLFLTLHTDARLDEWRVGDGEYSNALQQLARAFLADLHFDTDRTNRHDLGYAAPAKYVAPFLSALGVDPALAEPVWHQLTQLFRPAMRGRGASRLGGLAEPVTAVNHLDEMQAASLQIEKREITAAQILEVVQISGDLALKSVGPHKQLAPTVLGIKLLNAGLTPTTIHMAEDAALLWRSYETRSSTDSFGQSTLVGEAKHAIHQIASAIHEDFDSEDDGSYGKTMWKRLATELTSGKISPAPEGLSEALMLGAVCDLASECKIWFGPTFSIDEARAVFPSPLKRADDVA